SIAAHPMMGIGAMAVLTTWEWVRGRRLPRELLGVEGSAAVVASPAIVLFVSVPLLRDASHGIVALAFLDNLRRLSIPLLALLLPAASQWVFRRQALVAGLAAA